MAEMRLYRTYRYIDKNPVIDKVRTIVQDEGLFKDLKIVHEISGVATTTLDNWFHGETRNPQHATIAAVITSLGYEEQFIKTKDLNIEAERKAAADWLARQERKSKQAKQKKRANGGARSK